MTVKKIASSRALAARPGRAASRRPAKPAPRKKGAPHGPGTEPAPRAKLGLGTKPARRQGRRAGINLEIVNRSGWPVPRAWLANFVAAMAREASFRIKPQELAGRALLVAFLPEPEARGLNKHYRNKDYATDVLSFGGEGDALGELAICPKVISRQARERGLLARQELGYMVLHGFLHLLGYDHERGGRAAARMFRLQDEIWDALQKR